jgi:hypothetical protein
VQPSVVPIDVAFLQNSARYFAELRGESPPEVVLCQGLYNANAASARGAVPIDPRILAFLDLEEVAFYVAFRYVSTRENRSYLKRPGGLLNVWDTSKRIRQYVKKSDWIWLGVVVVASALALVLTSPPGLFAINYAVLGLVVLAVTGLLAPLFLRFLWGSIHRLFEQAVSLTGNREAGISFVRKYLTLCYTAYGRKPATKSSQRKVDRAYAKWTGDRH